MEQEKINVVYTERAAYNIARVAIYIACKGYPETAQKYRRRLFDFGNSLGNFADKYQLCRHPIYAKRSYHCAVYGKNWVFVYKVVKNQAVVFTVIHISLLA